MDIYGRPLESGSGSGGLTGPTGPQGPSGNSGLSVIITKKTIQTINNATSTTLANWTTTEYNDGYSVNLTTGIITIPEDGIYSISYTCPWNATADETIRECKNTIINNIFY